MLYEVITQLDVYLPFWPNVFVVVDIIILPLVAGLLLGRRLYQVGGWLLFLSMVGAFIFGFYYHFGLESPDHVAHAPATIWGFIFQLTSVLLFIFEGRITSYNVCYTKLLRLLARLR